MAKFIHLKKKVELYKYLKSHNINLHLDGARLFNSRVETSIALADYAKYRYFKGQLRPKLNMN